MVIADDHPVVLEGLAALFAQLPGIEVVARCGNGLEALDAVDRHHPDVLLLDLHMPGADGFAVLRELQSLQSDTRVVLLAAALRDDEAMEALRLGVRGVVLKELAPRLLRLCVQKVHAGETWLETRSHSGAVRALLEQSAGAGAGAERLTARERELVELVRLGLRNREIAARLEITEGTVKIHLHHIYKKLKVENRLQLMVRIRDSGLM